MLVYFQIDPPSSLDLGGEQDMWGSARTWGEGLRDEMLGGPLEFSPSHLQGSGRSS